MVMWITFVILLVSSWYHAHGDFGFGAVGSHVVERQAQTRTLLLIETILPLDIFRWFELSMLLSDRPHNRSLMQLTLYQANPGLALVEDRLPVVPACRGRVRVDREPLF